MDNCSNDGKTIEYLKSVDVTVIRNSTNVGAWIRPETNAEVYHSLPDRFILTDPDLEMNEKFPYNFVELMADLSEKYRCNKIGLALDISDYDKMYQFEYFHGRTIYDWEKQFWESRIEDADYELYWAPIDTTFCFINKKYGGSDIRIAGNFTAKHLPWYTENKLLSLSEVYNQVSNTTSISTISRVLLPYIESKYSKTEKDGEIQLLPKDEV